MRKLILIISIILISGAIAFGINYKLNHSYQAQQSIQQDTDADNQPDPDEEIPAAKPVPISPQDLNSLPSSNSALGGYDVLIADRGNNRILEVTPDKKIVWEYNFNLPKLGLGADDAFFADGGKSIIVNLEEYHIIEIIDYTSKNVIWSYGMPGQPGSTAGMLNTPDDTYKLPNGDVIVADIKNCRVIEISPQKNIVHQFGETQKCSSQNGFLNKPNGDTPLPNGHILISNIIGKNLIELDNNWQKVFAMPLPVKYPSDPQMTKAGNILVSDYSNPGQIVEVSKQGEVVWQFDGQNGDVKLNRPSLAIELPNGNILSNDDLNHRVIVIDKNSKQIVWQYGVTGKPGSADGQLNIPDGVDIIMRSPIQDSKADVPLTIGQVSRHANSYVGQTITLTGYVLKQENGYVLFSDEQSGNVGFYDLPVSGAAINNLILKQKYIIQGVLKYQGLAASNGNPYHFEITSVTNQ